MRADLGVSERQYYRVKAQIAREDQAQPEKLNPSYDPDIITSR